MSMDHSLTFLQTVNLIDKLTVKVEHQQLVLTYSLGQESYQPLEGIDNSYTENMDVWARYWSET